MKTLGAQALINQTNAKWRKKQKMLIDSVKIFSTTTNERSERICIFLLFLRSFMSITTISYTWSEQSVHTQHTDMLHPKPIVLVLGGTTGGNPLGLNVFRAQVKSSYPAMMRSLVMVSWEASSLSNPSTGKRLVISYHDLERLSLWICRTRASWALLKRYRIFTIFNAKRILKYAFLLHNTVWVKSLGWETMCSHLAGASVPEVVDWQTSRLYT